ncbi:hypothetical protein [Streptomyces omiyaensis]|uniref:Uncharacterized protein n=1 Tax=Streptomyces omiyaensis TaxID=68247 RepID=A0ABW7BPE0_9ACTN|nr:hypothetical protein [Streptomyces omiyaensis]GGY77552.1 hypothetical protein GCM10010363_68220 [Streptomyces omiyaensis]
MAETGDEARLIADGFERVYVESEGHGGPRAGLGDIGGGPHYFQGDDWDDTDEADAYRVWPANDAAVELEREQWAIFARWNERHGAGSAELETHPGRGGVDARYDELSLLLARYRQAPDDARRLVGEVRFGAGARYRAEGPDYWFRWRPAG